MPVTRTAVLANLGATRGEARAADNSSHRPINGRYREISVGQLKFQQRERVAPETRPWFPHEPAEELRQVSSRCVCFAG